MRFWDTSAIVPLLVFEGSTDDVSKLYGADAQMIVSWMTPVECASAIARAEHDSLLSPAEAGEAFARLDELAGMWREVEPSNDVRDIARRLLRVHRLRAADALQLAAAMVVAEQRPASLTLVTLDDRLEAAARKEGFAVVVPASSAK